MIKIFCDFCQSEIEDNNYTTLILDSSNANDRTISSYALCAKCKTNLENYLNMKNKPIIKE